jgi:transposase
VTAADEDTPIAVRVVAGQCHDAPLLKPLLADTATRVADIDEVVGDRGFDGAAQRQACRRHHAEPVIPARSNRLNPEPLNEASYRERNRVERLFGKLKEFRRVATRYDKRKTMFVGWLHLILGFICLRKRTNVNRA